MDIDSLEIKIKLKNKSAIENLISALDELKKSADKVQLFSSECMNSLVAESFMSCQDEKSE